MGLGVSVALDVQLSQAWHPSGAPNTIITQQEMRKARGYDVNHVYRTINRYYEEFESYRGVATLKSPWVWISLLSLVALGWSFYWYINVDAWPYWDIARGSRLPVALLFEAVAVSCWFRLQVLRDREIIERCQNRFESKSTTILELKALWLKHTLAATRTEYLELAERIDKMVSLRSRHKPSFELTKKQFWELIFSSESKGRILAMFMGACAGLVGLSIAGGATIDDVFDAFRGATFWGVTGQIAVISVFLFLILGAFRYVALMALLVVEIASDKSGGMNSTSSRRVSIFINQLIALHEIEKGRVKVEPAQSQNGQPI